MKSKVWFVPVAAREPSDRLARKAADLAETAGLANAVRKDGLVGILQHVGEGAGVGYVKPAVTRAIAAKVRGLGGKPFLTGSATLYRGWRSNACDHLMQAYEHGFTPMEIGCPVIMSDGLRGSDRVAVRVPNARHCREAFLGSAVALMDGMAVDIALIAQEVNGVVRVPAEAIHGKGEAAHVWVRQGTAFVRRPVATGISDGYWVEVKSGLKAGEVVRLP